MALATLRRSDRVTRSSALAAAAGFLLPNPSDSVDEYPGTSLAREVMGEISKKLPSNRDEVFQTALLQKLVAKELRDNLIDGSKLSDIRDRVGQKGLLSPSQYVVSFEAQFINLNITMGVSKDLAQSAISNPIRVEHLFPDDQGLYGIETHSIFTGSVPGRSDCCVVILALRRNATLSVEGGWLVFYKDVGVDPVATPVDTLKALALRYGCPVTAGTASGKFILLATSQVEPHQNRDMVKFEPGGGYFDFRASFRINYGKLDIALAFAIDIGEYMADLKRHGVKVTRILARGAM